MALWTTLASTFKGKRDSSFGRDFQSVADDGMMIRNRHISRAANLPPDLTAPVEFFSAQGFKSKILVSCLHGIGRPVGQVPAS